MTTATATAAETSKLLTEKEAASLLSTTPGTLNFWRATKRVDLPYIKLGRAVRYRLQDLVEFINKNSHSGLKGIAA